MAKYRINFINKINESLQVGDFVYSITSPATSVSVTDLVGRVSEINLLDFETDSDDIDGNAITALPKTPLNDDFIMFRKPAYNNHTNTSSLKGYYAEVTFSNSAATKQELFVVGSEVTESSK